MSVNEISLTAENHPNRLAILRRGIVPGLTTDIEPGGHNPRGILGEIQNFRPESWAVLPATARVRVLRVLNLMIGRNMSASVRPKAESARRSIRHCAVLGFIAPPRDIIRALGDR